MSAPSISELSRVNAQYSTMKVSNIKCVESYSAKTPLIKTRSRYLARHCDGSAPTSIRVRAYTHLVANPSLPSSILSPLSLPTLLPSLPPSLPPSFLPFLSQLSFPHSLPPSLPPFSPLSPISLGSLKIIISRSCGWAGIRTAQPLRRMRLRKHSKTTLTTYMTKPGCSYMRILPGTGPIVRL